MSLTKFFFFPRHYSGLFRRYKRPIATSYVSFKTNNGHGEAFRASQSPAEPVAMEVVSFGHAGKKLPGAGRVRGGGP